MNINSAQVSLAGDSLIHLVYERSGDDNTAMTILNATALKRIFQTTIATLCPPITVEKNLNIT